MLERLDSVPDNEPYLWADYLEIWATVSIDKSFSRGELASIFTAQPKPKSRGFSDTKWNDAVNFIGTRIALFGDDYPFRLDENEDTVYLKSDNHNEYSEAQKLYIALLFSANIKYIKTKIRHIFTSSFEKICLPIFASLMPVGTTVTPCWASAGNNGVYTGLLINKLTQIANDIRCTANFGTNYFKAGDRGDGGIDMLAWHDMADNRPSIPIAFAQCGCSKDEWVAKQLEASPAKMLHLLPVIHPWTNYYFLPQDLRWPNADWAHLSDIGAAIYVDRLRLIRLTLRNPDISHLSNIKHIRYLIRQNIRVS